jgi:hypothetical protein
LNAALDNSKKLGFSPSREHNVSFYNLPSAAMPIHITTPEETMPTNESNKESLSDVVSGFSIAFVGLCRALEQQHKVLPSSIVQAINLELAEMPSGPVPAEVKKIVTKIADAVSGEPIEVRVAQTTR